jgi:hypothetical protein
MTMFYMIDNIMQNIQCITLNMGIFYIILLVPRNNVIDLINVMLVVVMYTIKT